MWSPKHKYYLFETDRLPFHYSCCDHHPPTHLESPKPLQESVSPLVHNCPGADVPKVDVCEDIGSFAQATNLRLCSEETASQLIGNCFTTLTRLKINVIGWFPSVAALLSKKKGQTFFWMFCKAKMKISLFSNWDSALQDSYLGRFPSQNTGKLFETVSNFLPSSICTFQSFVTISRFHRERKITFHRLTDFQTHWKDRTHKKDSNLMGAISHFYKASVLQVLFDRIFIFWYIYQCCCYMFYDVQM